MLASYLARLLEDGGVLSLSETIPRHTQRLYELVDLSSLGDDLAERVRAAEEAIYRNEEDSLVNWDGGDLANLFEAEGFGTVNVTVHTNVSQVHLNAGRLGDWFSVDNERSRPTYSQHLLRRISPDELDSVRHLFEKVLTNRNVPWRSKHAQLTAIGRA